MAAEYHVNPRFRAYGKARLDIAQRAKTREQWEELWKPAMNQYPFEWGRYWKQCIEYRVEDYPAEVGFYIDVLGFPVNAFDPAYAQFTSPEGDFYIAVVPVDSSMEATPPESIRLQFMIRNINEAVRSLKDRGVAFDQDPQPIQPGSSLCVATFRTPHGIPIDIWGEVQKAANLRIKVADEHHVLEYSPRDSA